MGRHYTRFLSVILALALVGPAKSGAQTPLGAPAPAAGITLLGSPGQTCVQVEVQGEKPSPYNCLNQELQQQVQGTSQSQPKLPLGATSPSNAVGTFNEQGVSEQYGQNFGKSVIPYRPTPPVYGNVLGPGH
jgi:hypothetical protein